MKPTAPIVLVAMLASCSFADSGLSRDKAGSLVAAAFPVVIAGSQFLGIREDLESCAAYGQTSNLPWMVKGGYATLTDGGEGYSCQPVLTPKGEELIPIKNGTRSIIPLWKCQFDEITGVAPEQDGRALVTYTWNWGMTDTGKLFDSIMPLKGGISETFQATASLQKFDDGWRVTDVGSACQGNQPFL